MQGCTSSDWEFHQSIGSLGFRGHFAATSGTTQPSGAACSALLSTSGHAFKVGDKICRAKSSQSRDVPLQASAMQASCRGLSTLMAWREDGFPDDNSNDTRCFFPFLLTHNLAVTAEFSPHLKFPFNSQGAHVNSDDLSRSTTRKGASPRSFFPSLSGCG